MCNVCGAVRGYTTDQSDIAKLLQLFISDLSGDKSTLHSVDASVAYFSDPLTHGVIFNDSNPQVYSTMSALV